MRYARQTTRWVVPALLGMSLTMVVWWATSTLANALPGVGALDAASPSTPLAAVLLVAIAALTLLPVLGGPRPVAAELNTAGGRLVRVLGLAPRPGRWALLALVGVAAGIVALVLNALLIRLPVLASTNVTDARDIAIAAAHPVVAGLYLALHGAMYEELIYRGPVLVAAWVAARWPPSRRGPATIGAVVLSAVVFGACHLSWSLANAATAAASGLVYGSVALACRSLWPAAIAHATTNFIVGLV